jgi:hypothetical protein
MFYNIYIYGAYIYIYTYIIGDISHCILHDSPICNQYQVPPGDEIPFRSSRGHRHAFEGLHRGYLGALGVDVETLERFVSLNTLFSLTFCFLWFFVFLQLFIYFDVDIFFC